MKCPHCNQEHPDDYQFCPKTGKKIELLKACTKNPSCPDHGKYIWPSDSQYCPRCGSELDAPSSNPKENDGDKQSEQKNVTEPVKVTKEKLDSEIAFVAFKKVEYEEEDSDREFNIEDQECPNCGEYGSLVEISDDVVKCTKCGHTVSEDEMDEMEESFDEFDDSDEEEDTYEMHLLNKYGQKIGESFFVPEDTDGYSSGPKVWYNEDFSLIQVRQNATYDILEEKYYNITKRGITEGNEWIIRGEEDDDSEFETVPQDPNEGFLGMCDIIDKETKRVVVANIIFPQTCKTNGDWWYAYQINQEPQGIHFFNKTHHFFINTNDDENEDVYKYGFFSHEENRMGTYHTILEGFAQENRIITAVHEINGDYTTVRIRDERGKLLCEVNPEEYVFKRPYMFGKALAIYKGNDRNELVYFDTTGKVHQINVNFLDEDADAIDCTMVAPDRFVLKPTDDGCEFLMDLNGNILFKCKDFQWWNTIKDYKRIKYLSYYGDYPQGNGIVDLDGHVVITDYDYLYILY